MVRGVNQQANPPGFLRQRGRPEADDRRIPPGLERNAKALLMDRHSGFHRREALALPADSGADSTRLHSPAIQEKEEMNGPANSWTLH